ncbi:hypothetical protein KVH27_35310 [Streptomyces olivaceus]|uniref:hypothetical protein n=1 Tax=Streptomyces olivaceus TaxID=47716 RepID=UPI001CD02652|nr:hypothetical protein [Streptomyces olivaceus]MBZ6253621.1 hypothetical protein [Streptomyces olivaceus]
MATNTTPKKAPARTDEPTQAETVTAKDPADKLPPNAVTATKILAGSIDTHPKDTRTTVPAIVGPAPLVGVEPVTVRLSHHLGIGGKDFPPGAEILVSPDYARRLRTQGYVSRT